MNRYLALIIAVLSGTELQAFESAPRLVVNLVVDQLRSDYLDYFSPLYSSDGLKKLMEEGRVYEAASYPFTPVDKASAIATIATGTTPYYHGIIGMRWLDRNTLRPTYCCDDMKHFASPHRMMTSTVGDEMKVSSHGSSIVWSIAEKREAAILSAGHAADGALWIDEKTGRWRGSTYYSPTLPIWVKSYANNDAHLVKNKQLTNDAVVDLAIQTVNTTAMGRDEVSDLLSVSLSATASIEDLTNWQTSMEPVYMQLDKCVGKLVSSISEAVGADHVMFVVTSTGYVDEPITDLSSYRIPTGTFYINRTANLLNMFLSAVYGQGHYVESCFRNEVYLNHKLIEEKQISLSDIQEKAAEFLAQFSGVYQVFSANKLLVGSGSSTMEQTRNGFYPGRSGDLLIDVLPGWTVMHETDSAQNYVVNKALVPAPCILFGAGIQSDTLRTPVSAKRLAPTLAGALHIRAPNASEAFSLDF